MAKVIQNTKLIDFFLLIPKIYIMLTFRHHDDVIWQLINILFC